MKQYAVQQLYNGDDSFCPPPKHTHIFTSPPPLQPLLPRTFLSTRQTAVDFLNLQDRLYVIDGFAGWDPTVS